MIQSIEAYIGYLEGIRRRTLTFCAAIPPERVYWAPRPHELTFGDLVRHLAAAEQMFVGVAVAGRWSYPGHEPSRGPGLAEALAYLEASHTSAVAALGTLADTALHETRPALDGRPIKVWRVLMLLVEHEVHHRSQIASYLSEIGIEPPEIYGLSLEQVIAHASG
ncbi:MAG: hypothetical protein OHK0015_16110 [Chloroflexi bacterium OHK40]